MRSSTLIKNIITLLIWIVCLSLCVILYQYSIRSIEWWAEALTRIDKMYVITRIILIAGMLSSMAGMIFAEVRTSRAIETKIIRRFLPIFRFFTALIIWVVAGFFVLEASGINTKNILAWAGIGGAILALASKDLITNLLGSLSILFSRTFEIGDTIRIRTLRLLIEGLVEEITLNHTKVTNHTGEVVYVPNKTIYTESVENLSRRRFFTYEYVLPFAKSSPPHEISLTLKIIEGKISTFSPIEIVHTAENSNATDYLYRISVKLPAENVQFDREMRRFLIPYIFGRGTTGEKNAHKSSSLVKEETQDPYE